MRTSREFAADSNATRQSGASRPTGPPPPAGVPRPHQAVPRKTCAFRLVEQRRQHYGQPVAKPVRQARRLDVVGVRVVGRLAALRLHSRESVGRRRELLRQRCALASSPRGPRGRGLCERAAGYRLRGRPHGPAGGRTRRRQRRMRRTTPGSPQNWRYGKPDDGRNSSDVHCTASCPSISRRSSK
jgi:hypothetical protein